MGRRRLRIRFEIALSCSSPVSSLSQLYIFWVNGYKEAMNRDI